MSTQATNFVNLVKGNPISSITTAINMLKPNVREELMKTYKVSYVSELAIKLQ